MDIFEIIYTSYPKDVNTKTLLDLFLISLSTTIFLNIISKVLLHILVRSKIYVTSPKSPLTALWASGMKLLGYKQPSLHQYDNMLKPLPLPSVKHTISLLKASTGQTILENHGQERFDQFNKACDKFIIQTKKAQQLLYLKSWSKSSWLSDLWLNYAYLSSRSPLVPSSNIYMTDTITKKTTKQCQKAASFIYHSHKFFDSIKDQSHPPYVINDLIPLSMTTYDWVSATRIPGEDKDTLLNTLNSKFITVFSCGFIFKLNCFDKFGQIYHPRIFAKEIDNIIKFVDENKNDTDDVTKSGIGSLTSLNRTKWFNLRSKIPKNILDDIEKARFHITLDPEIQLGDLTEHQNGPFGKTVGNVWFDKSVSTYIYKNAKYGGNVEHSPSDAQWVNNLIGYLNLRELYDANGNLVLLGDDSEQKVDLIADIKFNKKEWSFSKEKVTEPLYKLLDTRDLLKEEVAAATKSLTVQRENFDTYFRYYTYGKEWIKKQKISPDAFFQVVIQKTFYDLKKFIPKVYESGMVAMYKDSRTETIRPVSKHSINFVKKPTLENLKLACNEIVKYKTKVTLGQGADRHLFALYCVGKYLNQKFDLFENFSEMYTMDNISTSAPPLMPVPPKFWAKQGGFGAQLPTGFGCCYYIMPNTITMNVSSFKNVESDEIKVNCKEFSNQIHKNLIKFRQLIEPDYDPGYDYEDLIEW